MPMLCVASKGKKCERRLSCSTVLTTNSATSGRTSARHTTTTLTTRGSLTVVSLVRCTRVKLQIHLHQPLAPLLWQSSSPGSHSANTDRVGPDCTGCLPHLLWTSDTQAENREAHGVWQWPLHHLMYMML